jgi:hypothetical protein
MRQLTYEFVIPSGVFLLDNTAQNPAMGMQLHTTDNDPWGVEQPNLPACT